MTTVDNLIFGHRAPETIVDHLTYGFPPGTVTGVAGPSGRGKSTVLYLIGLLLTPTSGAVFVDDIDASSWSDRKRSRFRASRIGFVFQDAALDATRTVLDNIVESTVYVCRDGSRPVWIPVRLCVQHHSEFLSKQLEWVYWLLPGW